MLQQNGWDVSILVAKGMTQISELDGLTVHEALENEKTNLSPFLDGADIVFTHDFVWLDYYQWINKLVAIEEDRLPHVSFYHLIHSAPGSERCPAWKLGRNKPNVFYAYPNETDRARVAEYLKLPDHKVIVIRLSNDVFDNLGGDENLFEKLGLMDAKYVGFYPAHPMPGKQVPEILKVIKRIKERGISIKYVFTLNGCMSGEAKVRVEGYRKLVNDYQIKDEVVFLPDYPEYLANTPYGDICKIWKIANLFITPSMSETTSLMLLEAMASKCLIVANDTLKVNHEILEYGAIFHPFGTHLDRNSAMDDLSLDRLIDLMEKWMNNHNSLYVLNKLKRTYSRKSIYTNYYLPLINPRKPKVSVIIPILNRKQETIDFTDKAIKSVRKYINTEVILINNEPSDKTVYDSDIRIDNPSNLGVSKAWNQGLSLATGDYYMILNSDAELPDDWGDKMIFDNSIVFPHVNQDQGDIKNFSFPEVHGCCFLANKNIFNKIGPFDERFFAYYEDADYWKRAEILGVKPIRANLIIKHKLNASSGSLPDLGKIIEESGIKFNQKWT